jgi:hypothetical protein
VTSTCSSAKYPTVADFANADPAELEKDINSVNFFRNKAKSIQTTAKLLLEKHNGELPQTLEELTQLAGVGRKTANVVSRHSLRHSHRSCRRHSRFADYSIARPDGKQRRREDRTGFEWLAAEKRMD